MTTIIYDGVKYSNLNMHNLAERFNNEKDAINYSKEIKRVGGREVRIVYRDSSYYVIWKTKSIKFNLFGA